MKIRLPIYRFNKQELEYNKIELTSKSVVKFIIGQLILGLLSIILLSAFLNTPKEIKLIRELDALKNEYYVIDKKISDVQYLLEVLEQKDSMIYQSLFSSVDNNKTFETQHYTEYRGIFYDTVSRMENKLANIEMRLEHANYRFRKIIVDISKNDERLSHTPAIQPINNTDLRRTSSGFGMRIHPIYKTKKMHHGMDFVAEVGTPIYATADGIVEIASNSFYGYGKYVRIQHNDDYKTAYGHMYELLVKRGQQVKRGDIIGTVGNTGLSTGPHLHYEVIYKGRHVDPINYYFHDLTAEQYIEMVRISNSIGKSLD